jgi:hypothetical protein
MTQMNNCVSPLQCANFHVGVKKLKRPIIVNIVYKVLLKMH